MDQTDCRRLGRRLRALRRERQITQEELAERAQLHPTHIAKIEAGMSWPSVPALLRIAAALEVPPGDLLALEPQATDPEGAAREAARLLRGLNADDLALLRELLAVLKRHGRISTGQSSRRPEL